jgi:hypothetical protein
MTLLALFTVLTTTVAVVSSIVAWRQAREARARSEARVTALSEAIAAGPAGDAPLVPLAVEPPRVPAFSRRRDTIDTRDTGADATSHDELFAQAQRASSGWRLRPALAIAAIAGITVLGTLLIASRPDRAAVEPPAAPLELLALRYSQDAGTTTLTGLVRNPKGGALIERATAVAFFFDDAGAFLASARAPLDFTRLAGGEESPFHVSLATPRGASRYRVSFRYAEGGIVPHVDRRKD